MSRGQLYGFLIIAAATRLLLQIAAMPPYAGLDEIYHVARLAFIEQEGRNPTTRELSVPLYLQRSIMQQPDGLPSFAEIGPRWPQVIRENPRINIERPLTPSDIRPYVMPNYEAQHPPLYYSLVAPWVKLVRVRSALSELQVWRIASVLFAIVIVIATARAGEVLFGPAGVVAATFLIVMPTWHTLVARVANDALACALIAIALAVTVSDPKHPRGWIIEAIAWALAVATKLYSWPIAVVAPLLWWKQRADRKRAILVTAVCAVVAVVTVVELSRRTDSAIGVVALDRPGRPPLSARVDPGELVRVFIASFAWTAGQHGNALRPLAILFYLGPVIAAVLLFVIRNARVRTPALHVLGVFALAQIANVVLSVMARRAGNDIPIGGKEGWYWYALAPVIVVFVIAPLVRDWPRVSIAILAWLFVWDVIITECALFHDYAGASSPLHPTDLFRWGPLHLPFTASLELIAVGPFTEWLVGLRIAQLIALALLVSGVAAYSRIQPSE